MPLKIRKRSNKYIVTEPNGKVLGTHRSKKSAQKQVTAININKRRR
jgi:hypothetical protein